MKKLLVTGASSGLGLHLSRHFSENGFKIFAVCRSGDSLQNHRNITHTSFDLSRTDQIEECATYAASLDLDCVIHAMGGGLGLKGINLTPTELDTLLRVNFLAGFHINNRVIEAQRNRKIINIIHFDSIATTEITASLGYTLAKSLLRPYVKHVARDLVSRRIYISNIQLGGIQGLGGAMDRLSVNNKKAYLTFIRERRPSGRFTPLAELTEYITLLLGGQARLHTGNTLVLDESESVSL